MKYALSLVALLTVSCGQAVDPASATPSGIDLSALDHSVDPCVDFYKFSCGGWIAQHPIGADGSRAAKFFEPYYATLPPLKKIIEDDAAGARAADDPFAALIGDYHASCLAAPNDIGARAALRALLAKVDGVTTLDDLARRIAAQSELGSASFFRFYVGVDPGDATRYTAAIYQGGVELADPSYYLDPQNKEVLVDYRAHILKMSTLVGGTPIDADAVIRVETALVTAFTPSDELRDPESLYHPMKPDEVKTLAPTFPWQVFWAEAGFPDGTLYRDYMSALDTLLLEVGGRILWRTTVLGQVVGTQSVDEAIGIWYPSHQSFLNLMSAPTSGENMRLRTLAVEHADLHRCRPY